MVVDLDPPVARVDTAAFAARALAERMHARLAAQGLACTRLIIEACTEHGEELVRTWRHDGLLSTGDVANRVRWQLEGWLSGTSTRKPYLGARAAQHPADHRWIGKRCR